MKLHTTLIACAGVLALSACGHDDETVTPYQSGVTASGPVSTLSTNEKAQFCQSLGAYVDVNLGFDLIANLVCLPQAIVLSLGNREDCEKRLENCMADAPSAVQVQANAGNVTACEQNLDQCNLDVSSLEGCINLQVDWVYKLARSISCAGAADQATLDAIQGNGAAACISSSPACANVVPAGGQTVLN